MNDWLLYGIIISALLSLLAFGIGYGMGYTARGRKWR